AVDRALADLARPLEVRDGAHAVGAHAQRLLDQLVAAGVGVHPLLRERHDLDGDQVRELLAQLEHGLQAGELGVGDVDVGPYELDALQDLLADAPERALLGALEGLRLLDVVPASDALEQRAARVGGAGAAAGEHVVEVEVRVDVGRDHQAAAEVDDLGGVGQARADLLDDAALDEDLAEPVVLAVDAGVDELPAGGLGPGSV